jgi:carbonic anhydrase/acetyltransferase-like protein (isoleucine patch superfamily)
MNTEFLNQPIGKGKEVFIADTARVFGNIRLGDEVSIWFGAVLRGDGDNITVENGSNIQDQATVHVDPGFPVRIGENCTIGHGAIVHGAQLENYVLVGMHATILNGAKIGEYSIIAAGALVPENMVIPPYSLVMGMPAKVVKTIDENFKLKIIKNAESYINLSKKYLNSKFNSANSE